MKNPELQPEHEGMLFQEMGGRLDKPHDLPSKNTPRNLLGYCSRWPQNITHLKLQTDNDSIVGNKRLQ